MKKTVLILVFSFFFIPLFAQQPELGLPGDNFNLYGVLNIFQNSPTLEDFERSVNNPDSKVNNLDLNGDGQIDYIHVIDNVNGPVHDIVLRDDVNANETQDVAVIEVEKDANNVVHIQIVGDEALYGKDYIVEPQQNTANPGYVGNVQVNRTYYPPSSWAIVGFMYAPAYVVWHSPYYWGYYPHYWHPWYPVSYNVYYGYHRPYYNYYRRTYTYSSPAAHAYYAPHRVTSAYVNRTYPPKPASRPDNHQATSPEHRVSNANPPSEKGHQVYDNKVRQTNETTHPANNQSQSPHQITHPANNQNRKTNQTSHPVNNQNQNTHQTSHPSGNQNPKIHQTQHPVNHQQAHPAKTNNNKEPEKK